MSVKGSGFSCVAYLFKFLYKEANVSTMFDRKVEFMITIMLLKGTVKSKCPKGCFFLFPRFYEPQAVLEVQVK